MAYITKRGNSWYVRVSVKLNGKYTKKNKGGFKTKAQATNWAKLQESNKVTGNITIPDKQLYPAYFRNWVDLYRADATNSAKRWYKFAAKVFDEYLGNVRLDQITRPILQQFLNELALKYSFATVKKIKTYLTQSLKTALYDDLISKDPTTDLKYGGQKGKSSELKFLEEPQMRALITEIENKPLSERSESDMMILLALQSGARYEELAGLTWSDIMPGNKISINKAWDQVDKFIKPTKTKSSKRDISISPSFINDLSSWKKDHNASDFVFQVEDTEYPITSASVNKQLKRYLVKIKSPKVITFHGLRHTHASWLISQGIDIKYVSERLGHSSITMTLEVYTHLLHSTRNSEDERSINLLENL